MAQAVVVGGGIVGLAVALRLLDRGFHVALVNRPLRQQPASWGNAGHVAVEQVAPLASLRAISQLPVRLMSPHGGVSLPMHGARAWLPFSWRLIRAALPHRYAAGAAAMKELLQHAVRDWEQFARTLDNPALVRFDGHYIGWITPKGMSAGRRHWLSEDIGSATVRDATEEELRHLCALAPKIAGAIRFSGTGQIHDPDAVLKAAAERIASAGGRIIEAEATDLIQKGPDVRVKLRDGRILQGDAVVVAAGVYSRSLLEQLGYRVPVIAERGYHVQYPAGQWPADMPPVVFEDRAMIVTRFASSVRAAGFVEFCDPGAPVDREKWRHLAGNAVDLGLDLGEPTGTWMGSRPTLPDYLPAIGRSRRAANLFYAFGHQHLGLTLAPATGDIVAALVMDETYPLDVRPFDLERFA